MCRPSAPATSGSATRCSRRSKSTCQRHRRLGQRRSAACSSGLELPEGLDAVALLPLAVDAGMAYVPGAAFYAAGAARQHAAPVVRDGQRRRRSRRRGRAGRRRCESGEPADDKAALSTGRCLHRRAAATATRWPWCWMATGLSDAQMAALRALDQPVGDDLPAAARPIRPPTTGCASSRRAASCPSPATRRWAVATPGWLQAACRARAAGGAAVRRRPGAHPARRRAAGVCRAAAARAAARSTRRWSSASRVSRRGARGRSCAHQHGCDNGPGWCAVMLTVGRAGAGAAAATGSGARRA